MIVYFFTMALGGITMFLANMTGDHYFSGKNGKPQRDTSEKLLKMCKITAKNGHLCALNLCSRRTIKFLTLRAVRLYLTVFLC